MKIVCFHTSQSNAPIYEAAERPAGAELAHVARPDLLAAAEAAGGMDGALRARVVAALVEAAADADAVLLTCSSLAPVVSSADERTRALVLCADSGLAVRAAAGGGRIAVLCAIETTLEPTGALFEEAAARTGAQVEMRLIEGAWARFAADDIDGYLRAVAEAADAAALAGADVAAFAQSSMAPAAALCRIARPLTNPAAGLEAAAAAAARLAAQERRA